MTLNQFFSKDYLLDPLPTYESKLYIPLLIFFGLLLVLALASRFMKLELKRLLNKFYYAFLTMGILGYIYLFARYEGLAWVGSRFALLLISIVLCIWVLYSTITTVIYIPKYKKQKNVESKFEKYLPKPKQK